MNYENLYVMRIFYELIDSWNKNDSGRALRYFIIATKEIAIKTICPLEVVIILSN